MRIGIVTTWFERGAAYVSRAYRDNLVKEGNEVYIYSRGGEKIKMTGPMWHENYVTCGKNLFEDNIDERHFFKWITDCRLEAILFNEQKSFKIVALTKRQFPNIKIGAYIDYYTEQTIEWYNVYDFVICNTNRHMFAMRAHPQKFYLRWGTDIDLFRNNRQRSGQIVFFHSVGMSARKGTDLLIHSFINGELYKNSKLVIHTQIPIEMVCPYKQCELSKYNIEVIQRTVTAPGLYHMGDIYVYPTKLDGLGLTMYEAMACGMPVITTDNAPMNEIITNDFGRLVDVSYYYCRKDAYYWPMAVCSEDSLIQSMRYYIENPNQIDIHGQRARSQAEELYNWRERSKELNVIFKNAQIRELDDVIYKTIMEHYKLQFFRNIWRKAKKIYSFFNRIKK